MKKVLYLFLVLVMCLSLCACGRDGGDSENNATEQENMTEDATENITEPATIDNSVSVWEAERIAKDYASDDECKSILLEKTASDSIKHIEIVSVEGRMKDTLIFVTVKGNFLGYDEYGLIKGLYVFTLDIPVYKSDGSIYEYGIQAEVRSS